MFIEPPAAGLTRGESAATDIFIPPYWNLSLLQQCGLKIGEIKNEFVLPEDALAAARDFFSEQKLEIPRPTLFIQPFTSSPQKNWPLENYLAVARHWRARGWQMIFGGGPADRIALEPARAEGFCIAAGQPLLVSLAWRNWPRSCSAATPAWDISPWPSASAW